MGNQCLRYIIYTRNIDVGKSKLFEIEKDKALNGIKVTNKWCNSTDCEMYFSDGERWIVLNPKNPSCRGYRWKKALIDVRNVTMYDYYQYIHPYGMYSEEPEEYFNFNNEYSTEGTYED